MVHQNQNWEPHHLQQKKFFKYCFLLACGLLWAAAFIWVFGICLKFIALFEQMVLFRKDFRSSPPICLWRSLQFWGPLSEQPWAILESEKISRRLKNFWPTPACPDPTTGILKDDSLKDVLGSQVEGKLGLESLFISLKFIGPVLHGEKFEAGWLVTTFTLPTASFFESEDVLCSFLSAKMRLSLSNWRRFDGGSTSCVDRGMEVADG